MTRPDNTRAGTVETLAAEVRTLVIGNRQVTLSVLGQLDTVHPVGIEPMGRVRPRDTEGEIHVIGRVPDVLRRKPSDGSRPDQTPAGTLVRSWLPTRAAWSSGEHRPVCWGSHPEDAPTFCTCGAAFYGFDPEANGGTARVDEWACLPLLVLAGLR